MSARESLELAMVHRVWGLAVGPQVAVVARPFAWAGGVLSIEATTADWAATLEECSDVILEQLNQQLHARVPGAPMVRSVEISGPGWDANDDDDDQAGEEWKS